MRSWEDVFYFLSNKREEGIAEPQRELAHGLLSLAWMNVSCFIHMAEIKRRKEGIAVKFTESLWGAQTFWSIL